MPVSRFRYLSAALALPLLVASCATFVTMAPFFAVGGTLNHTNAAVLVNDSGPNLVILAQGRNKVRAFYETGSTTTVSPSNLGFNIKAMAPGPDLDIWALGTDNKLYHLEFAPTGQLLVPVAPGVLAVNDSAVMVNGEDIAVSDDGSNIYVVDNNKVYRYDTDGDYVTHKSLPRNNAANLSGSAQRVAFDASSDAVYTLEPLNSTAGGVHPVLRLTRYSASLSVVDSYGDTAVTDGAIALRDFEISEGHIVWERSAGLNPTKLEFFSGGGVYDAITVDYGSAMPAGSLSSAGVQASFNDCGGDTGAYLWRARTNAVGDVLERHTLCAD